MNGAKERLSKMAEKALSDAETLKRGGRPDDAAKNLELHRKAIDALAAHEIRETAEKIGKLELRRHGEPMPAKTRRIEYDGITITFSIPSNMSEAAFERRLLRTLESFATAGPEPGSAA